MLIAITREVSPNIGQCELTHLDRQPIDLSLAQAQHHQYEATLEALGCQLVRLPAEPTLPDSVFVEDTAIVLDEIALLTRPGAASRQAETASIAQALAPYRTVQPIVGRGSSMAVTFCGSASGSTWVFLAAATRPRWRKWQTCCDRLVTLFKAYKFRAVYISNLPSLRCRR